MIFSIDYSIYFLVIILVIYAYNIGNTRMNFLFSNFLMVVSNAAFKVK